MPDFEITAPDGSKFVVTAPEGATDEQILSFAKQNFEQQQTPVAPRAEGGQPSDIQPSQPQDSGSALTRIGSRVANAASKGFGNSDIGLGQGARETLQDLNLVSAPQNALNPATAITSPVIEAGASLGDIALRGINSGVRGASALIGGLGQELGLSRTQSNMLERDVNNLANVGTLPFGLNPTTFGAGIGQARKAAQTVPTSNRIAERRIAQGLQDANQTPRQAADELARRQSQGAPAIIADLNPSLQREGRNAKVASREADVLAENVLQGRANKQVERIEDSLRNSFGIDARQFKGELDKVVADRSKLSKPLA